MSKKLSIVLLIAICGTANAGMVDEVAGGGMIGQPGQPGMNGGATAGAGPNRAMRTAVSLNAVQAAFDESDPRANVLHYPYDLDMTYKLRLREFMTTTVILPAGEAVEGYSLADEYNFTFMPYTGKNEKTATKALENIFTLSAKHPGGDTSLTVIGRSGRIYSFYLRSDSVKSTFMPTILAYVEDRKASVVSHAKPQPEVKEQPQEAAKAQPAPADQAGEDTQTGNVRTVWIKTAKPLQTDKTGEDAAATAEYLRSVGIKDPTRINFAYGTAGGSAALSPIKVFDDGYFTYFQFSKEGNLDKVTRLPVAYKVVDGYDTPINSRVEGGTLVAESVGKGWTLRNGDAHLCIRAR